MAGTEAAATTASTEAIANGTSNDMKDKANHKSNHPPIISVDTANDGGASNEDGANTSKDEEASGSTTPDMKTMGQARTPKHANKSGRDDDDAKVPQSAKSQITPDRQTAIRSLDQQQQGRYEQFSPPRPYEGRPLGGSGAFQPHEAQRRDGYYNSNARPPMHVSPPGGDYRPGYYGQFPEYARGGNAGYYDQQQQRGPPPPHMYDGHYRGGPPYRGPPPPYPPSYNNNGYGGDYSRRPPPYPGMLPHEYQAPPPHPPGHAPRDHPAGGHFSRAVSSSFGSRTDEKTLPPHGGVADNMPPPTSGGASVGEHSAGDDHSWKQLNQVASVDEAVMRERMGKKDPEGAIASKDVPGSNSSSLTNSPTEHHQNHGEADKKRASIPTPSKLASLDSLSSVASAQEPLNTLKEKQPASSNNSVHLSPGSSASLDLMKCSSGSSGLLHLASQGGLGFPPPPEGSLESKRSRDEADAKRDDANTQESRPSKTRRIDKDSKYKESPLSVACSPPGSPAGKMKGHRKSGSSLLHHPSSKQDRYLLHQSPGSYYDRPPSYTYSMDSAPPLPIKDGQPQYQQRPTGYPPLAHRPGSSSSSTMTPMQVEGGSQDAGHHQQPLGVGPSLPSWEIQQQDSFSGGSATGGAPLMNSFSFSQDYPMLSSSGSNLGNNHADMPPMAVGGPPLGPPLHMHPQIESRNQSFEGGHYHGSFSRTDSMDMSYGSRPPPHHYAVQGPPQPHHGGYIHHAPSWGSHGPPPGPPGNYGQYPTRIAHTTSFQQGGPPGPMMRNYSEERVSPPPGPAGMRGRGGFQPPPEFLAPHNPHLSARRPQQAVYLVSSPPGGHDQSKAAGGGFSWSKDDDIRLTEIMKKYKNPRDWEPIAKEHGRGKT